MTAADSLQAAGAKGARDSSAAWLMPGSGLRKRAIECAPAEGVDQPWEIIIINATPFADRTASYTDSSGALVGLWVDPECAHPQQALKCYLSLAETNAICDLVRRPSEGREASRPEVGRS